MYDADFGDVCFRRLIQKRIEFKNRLVHGFPEKVYFGFYLCVRERFRHAHALRFRFCRRKSLAIFCLNFGFYRAEHYLVFAVFVDGGNLTDFVERIDVNFVADFDFAADKIKILIVFGVDVVFFVLGGHIFKAFFEFSCLEKRLFVGLIQKFFQLVDDIVRLAHAGFDKFFGIFSDLFVKSFVVIAQFFKFVLHVFEFFFRFYFVDFCLFGQFFGGFSRFFRGH